LRKEHPLRIGEIRIFEDDMRKARKVNSESKCIGDMISHKISPLSPNLSSFLSFTINDAHATSIPTPSTKDGVVLRLEEQDCLTCFINHIGWSSMLHSHYATILTTAGHDRCLSKSTTPFHSYTVNTLKHGLLSLTSNKTTSPDTVQP